MVDIPGCDRYDQASETASQVLCHSEALTILRSRHLGYHFFKPDIFTNICQRGTALCSKCRAAEFKQRVLQEIRYGVVIVVPVVYITIYVQIYFN
jgi:hypothetical protein